MREVAIRLMHPVESLTRKDGKLIGAYGSPLVSMRGRTVELRNIGMPSC